MPPEDSIASPVPPALKPAFDRLAQDWEAGDRIRRLWDGDATLWTGAGEARWLGWLRVVPAADAALETLDALAHQVRTAGFEHAVLLGMGGSSLCPDVLRQCFGRRPGAPALHVLDSTDPAQVRSVERGIDYRRTLFIVSSKSGTTLEPDLFLRYFSARARAERGAGEGARFIAVTDPGSQLEELARAQGFWRVYHGVPSIGGRFSALSNFGLAPAAVMGLDVRRLLARAAAMRSACAAGVPLRDNPGAMLGLLLAAGASAGRNKVTFVISPTYRPLGAWLEQLLAESTGKDGVALIPVDGEDVGRPDVYGDDRLFVYVRDEAAPDGGRDAAIDRLERAGQPVIRLSLRDPYDLAAEFYRWEFATAVAGAAMGINPFDQPDVEASKVETRRLTAAYEAEGALPAEQPVLQDGGIAVHADPANLAALAAGRERLSPGGLLAAHCRRLGAGDYFALLAYVEMREEHAHPLRRIRHAVREASGAATAVGFGPRFLHSTGQAYKGGPDSGVFIQITCDDGEDLPLPGRRYSFGVVKAAQARGDYRVLADRGRRLLRLHLTGDVAAGLNRVADLVQQQVQGQAGP